MSAGAEGFGPGPERVPGCGGGRREAVGQGAELCGQQAELPPRRRDGGRRGRRRCRGTGRAGVLSGAQVGRLLLPAADTGLRGGPRCGTARPSSPLNPHLRQWLVQVMEWPPLSRRAETRSQAQVRSLRSTRSTAVPAVAPAPRAASKGCVSLRQAQRAQVPGQSGMLPGDPAGCPHGACSQSLLWPQQNRSHR